MASPGNQCYVSCIGTLSLPIVGYKANWPRSRTNVRSVASLSLHVYGTLQLHLGYIPYTFILTLDLDPLTLTLNFPSTYGFDFQSVSNYGHDLASHMEKYRSKVSLSKKL